jgi:hypothetical protein
VAERKRHARSIWLSRLKLRSGPNVAAVALANKNARVMWALLARSDSYRVRTDRASRGLREENQELDYLPKVAKVVLQCWWPTDQDRRLPNL